METWWDALPESVRERVDGLVLRDDRLRAIRVTMEAVQALKETPAQRPGLYDCQRAVMARYQELAGRSDRAPAPPQDVETLATRIRRLPGQLAALEAIWDGDTDGWFVVLIAVLDDPQHEVDLAWIRHGSDLRVFNGQVSPWPEAQEAMETGTALAEHFNVPFHFASPHRPDEEAPRWRTTL